MQIGNNLKKIREENGFLQSELAERINVSQKTISSWETNRTEPSMGDLNKIAVVLRCSIPDIIGHTSQPSAITMDMIMEKMVTMSDTELTRIINYASTLKERGKK